MSNESDADPLKLEIHNAVESRDLDALYSIAADLATRNDVFETITNVICDRLLQGCQKDSSPLPALCIFEAFLAKKKGSMATESLVAASTVVFPLACEVLWRPDYQDRKTFTRIDSLKQIIVSLTSSSLTPIRLVSFRFLHMLIMTYSYTNSDSGYEERGLSLVHFPEKHCFLRIRRLVEEGFSLLAVFMKLMRRPDVGATDILALVNLCTTLLRTRPAFLPIMVPVLIDLYEDPPSKFTPGQKRNIEHTLRILLSNVVTLVTAEKFYPLLLETLEKVEKSAITTEADEMGKKRKLETGEDAEDIEAFKRIKSADVTLTGLEGFDVTSVPLPLILEMIIGSLQTISIDRIKKAIEVWRPSVAILARDPRRRDPRTLSDSSAAIPSTQTISTESPKTFELAPVVFDAEQLYKQRQKTFTRLLMSQDSITPYGIHPQWVQIVSKVAASFISAEHGTDKVHLEQESGQDYIRSFVDFVLDDFSARYELAINWLKRIWMDEHLQVVPSEHSGYDQLLSMFLERLLACDDVPSSDLSKMLPCLPRLTNLHLEEMSNNSRKDHCFEVYQELLLKRPTTRERCIKVLLSWSGDLNPDSRGDAIDKIVGDVFNLKNLSQIIETAAIDQASLAKTMTTHDQVQQSFEQANDQEIKQDIPEKEEIDYGQFFDLLIALCGQKPSLIGNLLLIYDELQDDSAREYIDNRAASLARSLDIRAAEMTQIIRSHSKSSRSFVSKVLTELSVVKNVPAELIRAVKDMINSDQLSPEFLMPLLPFLEKETVFECLPKLLNILDGEESQRAILRESILKILSNNHVRPADILVQIHRLEDQLGIDRCIEATQLCLSMSQQFKQDTIASTLQQLVDLDPLPSTILHTYLQSLALYKQLSGFVQSLLARLIPKHIWLHPNPRVWSEFVKCCKMLLPGSLSVMIQLPPGQIQGMMEKVPELRMPLKEYLYQQPPSLRHRYAPILAAVERIGPNNQGMEQK